MAGRTRNLEVAVTADVKGLKRGMGDADVAVKGLNTSLAKSKRDLGLWQDEAGRWRAASGRFASDAEKASAGVEKLGRSSGKLKAELGKLAKTGALGAVAGLGIAFVSTVKTAGGFEKRMKNVEAVTNASEKQLRALSKAAISMGTSTGLGATKAAEAIAELAKGGLSAQQIITGGLKGALDLAAAGELELADAASTTANALNLFKLRGNEASHVADALATAANATTANVDDFGLALSQGGSAAKAAGLTFDETVVGLEALAAAGIKGSDAGTSLKTSLLQLVNPTAKQKDASKAAGLSFLTQSGEMKSLSDISGMLRTKTDDMTKAQRTALFATVAGTDGVRTLLSLYDAGPARLDKFAQGLAKQGTAAEVARKKQEGFEGSLNKFRAAMEAVQITVGTAILPTLTKAADATTKFVNQIRTGTGQGGRFAETMRGMAKSVQPVLIALRGLVRVAAGVLSGDWAMVWRGVKDIAGGALKGTINSIKGLTGAMSAAVIGVGRASVRAFARGISGLASTAAREVRDTAKSVGTSGRQLIDRGAEAGKNIVTGVLRGMGQLGHTILRKIKEAITFAVKNVGDAPGAIGRAITGGIGDLAGAITPGKAMGGRIPGAFTAADTVPALLSPQEFVVTGDGESTLEQMTFPGVLDWLQGVQRPHFAKGGRAGGMVSGGRVAQVARQVGFRGAALVRMVAIARRESGFNERAQNLVPPDHSIGLWQINQLAHHGRFGSDGELMDPLTNARAAWALSNRGVNFQPWTTNAGLSAAHLDAARRIVAGAGGTTSAGTTTTGGTAGTGYAPRKGTMTSRLTDLEIFESGKALATDPTATGLLGGALERIRARRQGTFQAGTATTTGSSGRPRGATRGAGSGTFKPGGGWAGTENLVMQAIAGHGQRATFKRSVAINGNQNSDHNTWIKNAFAADISPGGDGLFSRIAGRLGIPAVKGSWNNFPNKPLSGFRSQLLWHAPDGSHKDHVHLGIRGMRRGGRAGRRMQRGGRAGGSMVSGLLRGLAGANRTKAASTLTTLAELLPKASDSALRGWVGAAQRMLRPIKTVTGRNRSQYMALKDFIDLVGEEESRRGALAVADIDTATDAFDRDDTDLQNRLIVGGVGVESVAGRQAILTGEQGQLAKMVGQRDTIALRLQRAQRARRPNKALIGALSSSLVDKRSAILAQQASIAGIQSDIAANQPTQQDFINAKIAEASLTPGTEDDLNAAAANLDYAQGLLIQARDGGDPRAVTEAAQNFKSAADAVKELQGAMEDTKRAMEEHTAAVKESNDLQKRTLDFAASVSATSSTQAWKALADILSGQIVGRGFAGRRGTPGSGVEYAYAPSVF